jgi:hypothetical protein
MKKPKAAVQTITRVPRCSVCHHPDREEIDLSLVGGRDSFRAIAGRYALSSSSLDRHKQSHINPEIQKALVRKQEYADQLRSEWETRLDDVYRRNIQAADRAAASDKPDWVAGARFLGNVGKNCEVGLAVEGKLGRHEASTTTNYSQIIVIPTLTDLEKLSHHKTLDLPSSDDDEKQKT